MNKEWSELNKEMQLRLKKKETFASGIDTLLDLRNRIMEQISEFKKELSAADFCAMPYINADGYHNKTIAYSLWHIFRIEDIVAHTLIADNQQVFFEKNYRRRINSPIITTGNELVREQIADFSWQLNLSELYQYIAEVDKSTAELLKSLSFEDMKIKMTDEKKQRLQALNVVSESENAFWLIDYWCTKNIQGLIQMPFSRHWIMHIEACLRIKSRLQSNKWI